MGHQAHLIRPVLSPPSRPRCGWHAAIPAGALRFPSTHATASRWEHPASHMFAQSETAVRFRLQRQLGRLLPKEISQIRNNDITQISPRSVGVVHSGCALPGVSAWRVMRADFLIVCRGSAWAFSLEGTFSTSSCDSSHSLSGCSSLLQPEGPRSFYGAVCVLTCRGSYPQNASMIYNSPNAIKISDPAGLRTLWKRLISSDSQEPGIIGQLALCISSVGLESSQSSNSATLGQAQAKALDSATLRLLVERFRPGLLDEFWRLHPRGDSSDGARCSCWHLSPTASSSCLVQ